MTGEQRRYGVFRRVLLCPFLAGTPPPAYNSAIEGNLHIKLLVVIRAGLAGENLAEHLIALLLHQLLKLSFIVGIVELGNRNLHQDKPADKAQCRIHAAI